MDTTNLVVYLPFDSDINDRCGGTWTAHGSPTIQDGKLTLDGSSYLERDGGIVLGGQDFTLRFYVNPSSDNDGTAIGIFDDEDGLTLYNLPQGLNHLEFDYVQAEQKFYQFLNGVLISPMEWDFFVTRRTFELTLGAGEHGADCFNGTISDFMIYDGVALHTEDFTLNDEPQTTEVSLTFDVVRRIDNIVEVTFDVQRKVYEHIWRYENPGTADLLAISGNTVTNLPVTQSKTGIAFWQKQRVATFPIPATKELWAKFDVYYSGSNKWRAYDRLNGNDTGIGRYSDATTLICYINGPTSYNVNPKQALTTATLHTILLHMVSDSTNGLVEAWLDGVKCYSDDFVSDGVIYKGNVENGADFENFYIQSEDKTNLFSNVIISNAPIDLDDNVRELFNQHVESIIDVTREVTNDSIILISLTLDVIRTVKKIGKYLKAWLPFDVDATTDLCGNTWTATGDVSLSTTIKKFGTSSVHLPNGARLVANNIINLNADKWTFDCWVYLVSSSSDEGYFALSAKTDNARYGIINANDGIWIATTDGGSWQAKNSDLLFPSVKNQWVHLAIVKNGSTVTFYQDGVAVWYFTTSALNNSGAFIFGGNYYGYDTDIYFDEVCFVEGKALWTENFTTPTAEDYSSLHMELGGSASFSFAFDVECVLVNESWSPLKNLKAYLPFDSSPTEDLCGNTWTASGSPVIEDTSLELDGSSSYIEADIAPIEFFNSDFTIHFWMTYKDSKTNEGGFFTHSSNFAWQCYASKARFNANCIINGSTRWLEIDSASLSEFKNSCHHFAIVRKDNTLYFFFDGQLKTTYTVGTFTGSGSTLYIGKRGSNYTKMTMDEFMIHPEALWIENFSPPTDEDYADLKLALGATNIPLTLNFDVECVIKNDAYIKRIVPSLKVWLPFNSSVTEDLCGNTWTAYGSPMLKNGVLNLPGNSSYLALDAGITLGGQNFTIRGKFNMGSATSSWGRLFELNVNGGSKSLELIRDGSSNTAQINGYQWSSSTFETDISTSIFNQDIHIECDYVHDSGKLYVFCDGVLKTTVNVTFTREQVQYVRLGASKYESGRYFVGTIDEFQIFDGVALHIENFTPPTASEYEDLAFWLDSYVSFTVDVERKISRSRKPVAQYVSFTGNAGSYGLVPLDVLAGATTFTIEVKFSTASTKNSGSNFTWGTIVGREIGGYDQNDFGLCVNNGKLCFWTEPKSGGSSSTHNTTSSAIVNDGKSHKAAVVSSGGAIDLYCDGKLVAHTDNVNAKITDTYKMLIAYNSDSSSYLQTDLWEARFWSIARTKEQIFADIQGDEAGLEAWYIPNGSATLFDGSINRRDATLYGTPAYTYIDILPIDLSFDVKRVIANSRIINVNQSFDVVRSIVKSVSFNIDVKRRAIDPLIAFDIDIDIDVVRKVKKLSKLRAWLPFDNSVTEDKCGNSWIIYGNPTIGTVNAINGKALQLDGSSYIKLSGIELGGRDFYIDGWVYVDSSSPNNARVISIVNPDNGYVLVSVRKNKDNANRLAFWNNYYADVSQDYGYTNVPDVTSVGQRVYFQLIYRYTDKIFALCINDNIYIHRTDCPQYNRRSFDICIGAFPNGKQGLIGSVDELRIYDGRWFSYAQQNLPTADDYIQLAMDIDGSMSLEFDVERKVRNAAKTWRYVNAGTADNLLISGTTLTDLPATQSKTGTAFYQTQQVKCFDLPATPEVWIKFDVYFDGSNRWRAYNGGANGTTGITAQTNGTINYFTNGNNNVHAATNAAKKNQLQTVLLHMVSGSSAGVIEAWVDGTKIYTYTGDVNHGENFADIYLQSNGSGTFFSNVIISNAEIGLEEGWYNLSFDTKREIVNDLFLLNCLKVWLPFNSSVTEDLCGNTWTTSGSPTIAAKNAINDKALQLDGSSYLQTTNIELGGQDFTICGYCYTSSDCIGGARVFNVHLPPDTGTTLVQLRHPTSDGSSKWRLGTNSAADSSSTSLNITDSNVNPKGERHYFEVVYQYAAKTMTFYIDGVQKVRQTNCPQYTRQKFIVDIGTQKFSSSEEYLFTGSIDEFQIYDGVALHTENFDVPKPIDYVDLGINLVSRSALVLYVDVARRNIGGIVECVFDSSRTLTNAIYHPSFNGLKAYLPFDNSVTEDLCGNEWTVYGHPTISTNRAFNFNALQLDGSSYLKLAGIEFGERDFCIDFWLYFSSLSPDGSSSFCIHNPITGYNLCYIFGNANYSRSRLYCWRNNDANISQDSGSFSRIDIDSVNTRVNVRLLYRHSTNHGIYVYINDQLGYSKTGTDCPQYTRQVFDVYIGAYSDSTYGTYGMLGMIDEFRIYEGTFLSSGNGTPPTFADYIPIKLAYYDYAKISFNFDVQYLVKTFDSIKEYWKYLKVWLSFDNSVTEDLCGNIWSVSGNPTISPTNAISNNALQLDGSSYLLLNNIELGGQDFTIDAYVNMSSSSGSYADIFSVQDNNGFLTFVCRDSSYFKMWYNIDSNASGWSGYNPSTKVSSINKRVHMELVYYYSAKKIYLFIDGVLTLGSFSIPQYTRKKFRVYIGTTSFIGSIDEFRIFDGIALHNTSFTTPPRAGDYELFQRYHFVTVVSDVACKINNCIEVFYDVRRLFKWRYTNTGVADLLSISGTTLTDLPTTQSKTGTAFYQTQRAKCFDIPATAEVWIKFDVYFDGSNRWRAYNGDNNSTLNDCGVATQTNGSLTFFIYNQLNQDFSGVCKKNKLQTVLLHMVTGSSAGVIEAWVDGTKIYRYTGNVNHGEDFADIYLQSDGSGTFFSNVIISNYEVGLDETLDGRSVVILFDVEINIGRLVSFYLDVKCIVITQDVIEQLSKFSSALKVWLPFDTSPIADVCSNEWLAYGNPIIQNNALYLDGLPKFAPPYLKMISPFTIEERRRYTIACWFSATNNNTGSALPLWSIRIVGDNYCYGLTIGVDNVLRWFSTPGGTYPYNFTEIASSITDGKKHYIEVIFTGDSDKAVVFFLDGVQVAYISNGRPHLWGIGNPTDYTVGVGLNLNTVGYPGFIGTIDEFQIYYGVYLHNENHVPPVEASYTALRSKILENSINVTIDVMRLVKDDTCLKVHLTFDDDVTTDECGNEWTAVGNLTIGEEHAAKGKALQLDGESYLKCNSTFTIGGQPFTIDCWVYAAKAGQIGYADSTPLWSLVSGNKEIVFLITDDTFVDTDKQVYHCALVSDGLNLYQFIDGTLTDCVSLVKNTDARQQYAIQNAELYVGHCPGYNNSPFTGTIDEFRLIIGDALWTESFTPSITDEILDWTKEVVLNCDVMRILNNVEKPWIYYNIGVANGLTRTKVATDTYTVNNLPENDSRTGCAIITYDEFGFPVPVTYNFWIRFDFTPESVGFFWSAHKSKNYGVSCDFRPSNSRTTAYLYMICDSYQGLLIPISGNATSDRSADVLHTILLHIKSGLTDGVIEAWVDKTKSGDVNYLIDRYVGNVHDGAPIYDFYIRSGGYFSNIIISNEPITFDSEIPETHLIELVLDVKRQIISNFVTYNLDIIRNVIAPITIPLSGEDIEYTLNRIRICSIPQKFILPKISKFYIYGDLVGKVHIYSDTNVEGIINGSYYFAKNSIQSEFIESNEFYIVLDKSIISAQDVIKSFIHKLVTNRLIGTPALNRAVIYATDGRYVSWDDFINQFLNCLNSIDYKRFLNFYCDINLDNDDTGAILGWDAGGVAVRTAISVVTESSSTDTWKIPVLGSSIMISNLLVHFPRSGGASANLTNLEKYILSGLNSEWIYRSLELIKYSLGISFEDSDITYEMYIQFSRDSSSSALAYTSAGENDTSCILTINMYYYSSIDITDVNGLSERANLYLDRTIVHELVHAVMELISYAHGALPEYIIEGLAELVHGIDDFRKNNIVELLTTRKNDLISALTSEQYAYPEDAYSAGYILLRFLAKQGQHINNTSSNKLIINNLLVVNDLSLVIKTVECDVTTVINNYVITQCDVTTVINNYVITQCDVTINHYMMIEYVLDVYCECVVGVIEFISVQINVICSYTISVDVFRRIIGLNVTKFNIMMYGVSNVHMNSVTFNVVMYGVSSSISSSVKFVIVDPAKTRTKLHQCIKPVVMLMLKPINNTMIADQVSDLALRSTPLYPDRSNKGYNTRG